MHCTLFTRLTDFKILKIGVVLLYSIGFSCPLIGQSGFLNYGGIRGMSMGHTGVTFESAEGQFLNPAVITSITDWGAALSSERRFEDAGINQFGLSVSKNMKNLGHIGLVIQQVGVESYNQTKIGLGYARKLNKDFSLGVQFNAQQVRIDEYGSKSVFNMSLGLRTQINEEISVGLAIHNPIPIDLVEGEETPLILMAGADYKPNEQVYIIAEIEKDVDFPVNVKLGIEYRPVHRIIARLGVTTEPTNYNFGAGVLISKNIWIDIGVSYNQELGLSPGFGIALR